MISGLPAPGARGFPVRAGGRLVYSTLSTCAISSSMTCHMRSSTRLSTSSLPAGGGTPGAGAGAVAGTVPGAPVCCASKLKIAQGINRKVRIGKEILSQHGGQFGGSDRLPDVTLRMFGDVDKQTDDAG